MAGQAHTELRFLETRAWVSRRGWRVQHGEGGGGGLETGERVCARAWGVALSLSSARGIIISRAKRQQGATKGQARTGQRK